MPTVSTYEECMTRRQDLPRRHVSFGDVDTREVDFLYSDGKIIHRCQDSTQRRAEKILVKEYMYGTTFLENHPCWQDTKYNTTAAIRNAWEMALSVGYKVPAN